MAQDATQGLKAAAIAGELGKQTQAKWTDIIYFFDGARALKDRYRSLEVVIENKTKHNLLFKKEYFNSGTWFSQPDTCIAPGDATTATLANRAGSVLCGVTGGMSWKIEGTEKFLVLGFTNPTIGCYKLWIGVRKEPEPEYGYLHSQDDNIKFQSEYGFTLHGQMGESNIAMKKFTFKIEDGNYER